jgi:hypothetical protein
MRLEFIIQSDFEGCADILTNDRTPRKVTIEPMMPYTNVDIFREKGVQSFSKKVWEPLNFIQLTQVAKTTLPLQQHFYGINPSKLL